MATKKNKTGRPTKYRKEFAEQAYKLTLVGMIDVELADFFEVAESTLHKWKKDHKEFSESIKKGKDISDAEVVMSLRKRAMGYRYDEVKVEESQDGIKKTVTTKEVAPDPVAQIFWMTNRQRDKWKRNPSEENRPIEFVMTGKKRDDEDDFL